MNIVILYACIMLAQGQKFGAVSQNQTILDQDNYTTLTIKL